MRNIKKKWKEINHQVLMIHKIKRKGVDRKMYGILLILIFHSFARDDILINYKYFKKDDEPNQKGMSIEEVMIFQNLYSGQL